MKKVRKADAVKRGSNKNNGSEETTIARLLLVCADGMCKTLPEKHPLHLQLQELRQALQKTVPRGKARAPLLAKELATYFKNKKKEEAYRDSEKDKLKDVVLSLTQTIKTLSASSGGFDKKLDRHIKKIQDTDNAKDILVVRDRILTAASKTQTRITALREEVEKYKHIASDLTRQLRQSEAKALIDPLTRVFNRSAYNLRIKQAVKEYERYKDPSAMVVADIDLFKRFNDTYGHRAGDKILHFVAATLQETIRKTDQVFRYGGEELVLLLSKIDMANAIKLSEKVRQNVEEGFVTFEGQRLRVTISLGIALFKKNDTAASVFQRADLAMYQAKKKGRNRVEAVH